MKGFWMAAACAGVLSAQAALTVEDRNGELVVLRDGKVVVSKIEEVIGAECDVKRSVETLPDGTKVWNRWCETKDRRYRVEVGQRADGAVEISIAGQADADSRVRSRVIRLSVPHDVLDGKSYDCLRRQDWYVPEKGAFAPGMAKTQTHWLAVDGLLIDMYPTGVNSGNSGSTFSLCYPWDITRDDDAYHFTGSRTVWPAQGCFIGARMALREGRFEDYDKHHFFRYYSYKTPFEAKRRLAFGAPKVGDGFVDGNVPFDAGTGYGWVGGKGEAKVGYREGRLYSHVAGTAVATYRLAGLPDGWYVVSVDCGNRPGTKNAFSVSANGQEFAKQVSVAKGEVRFLSRVVHVKGGACDLAFAGSWIVSSVSVQPLVSEGENFTIGRGYWLADGYEPTDIYRNEDFARLPVATLRDDVETLPEPGGECKAKPREVPMPVERPDGKAPELAWLQNARMYRLDVSPAMARPENRKSTQAFLDGELNGRGYPAVLMQMNGVLFQRHSAPQHLEEGIETIRYFVDEMHRRGIKVIDHHDATMCENNHSGYRVYMERLPEALRSNVDNLPSHHYCINNPAFKKTYMAYLRRLVELGVDGFQIDELEFWKHGCTCVHCRRAFARDVGWQRPLNECDPSLNDVNSPFRQRWDDWRRKTVTNWFVEFRRFVKDLNPNLVLSIYCTNSGMFGSCPKSGRTTDLLDQRRVMNLFGTEVLDPNAFRQARAVLPYFRMKNILIGRDDAPVWDWFYTYDWKAEYAGWALSQLTGQTPILYNTTPPSAPKFREWGSGKAAMARKGAKELARVAILYSENSRDWNRGEGFVEEMFGVAQALEQMHVPYVFVTDAQVEKGVLGTFRFLFTGASECLSDKEIKAILDFAAQGGAVYVSGKAGTADVFGNPRARWAFQDVFGRTPSAAVEPGTPQEVAYRKGRFIYSAGYRAKPFEMRECEWPTVKCPFKYDAAGEEAYQAELATFLKGCTVWSCKAPKKVYTSLWRESDGRIAAHFFNATGAPDPVFGQCFERESPTNAYPKIEKDIHFAVPGTGFVSAVAESPDFAGAVTLPVHRLKDGRVAVTLPKDRLTTYTLVRLTYAKGEDDVLSGTDQWGCRKAHPAVVNAVTDDPKDPNRLSLRGRWLFMMPPGNGGRRNSHDNPFFGESRQWDFCTALQVPGCWEAQGIGLTGQSECWEFKGDNSEKPIRNKAMGEGWYRKKVAVPATWTGKRVWLKVGGVKSCGWFWVNGGQAAHVYNYCGTVKYDVTDLVRPGEENEIIAQVSNLFPSRKGLLSNMHRWGGLYRDVELEATPDNLIDDVWVRGDFDRQAAEVHVEVAAGAGPAPAELRVRAEVEGERAEAIVEFGPGEKTAEVVVTVPLRKFRPWSPENPALYLAKVSLLEDGAETMSRRERFGVRKLEVRGKEFYLNNRPYFLRGFGDDHVYPLTGLTPADRKEHLRHLRTAHEAGFNFVRLHTHCEVPEYFEAADEAGILVQAELPYINGDIATENFSFDPVADTRELCENYRRYPSFAVYSGGNEGSFGKALDRRLYRFTKELDPDRLKIVQDTQMEPFNTAENSDFGGGPVMEWPRGGVEPGRPFVCHEYLNLTVKLDPSTSGDFTGAWLPPVLPEKRYGEFSSWFGLDQDWADRLQVAQHRLQAYWQKHGLEAARLDPCCDGYCFWTIVDVVVRQGGDYSSQGLFDAFWRPKRGGLTAREVSAFNGPVAVLLDDPAEGWVYRSGDALRLDFYLSQYGESELKDAKLAWRFLDGSKELSAGTADIGDQPVGPVRKVGSDIALTVPDVARPLKARLEARVGPSVNGWDFWFFPKRERRSLSGVLAAQDLAEGMKKLYSGVLETTDGISGTAAVTVARPGDPLIDAALARGRDVVVIGPVCRSEAKPDRPWFPGWDYGRVIPEEKTRGFKLASRDIKLGWWYIGHQAGTALADSPILRELPHEGYLSPLLFRIIGKGAELTADLREAETRVIVGEGRDKCYGFLTTWRKGRSRVVEINGLDVLSGYPEGTAVLDGVLAWLKDVKNR